MNFLCWLNYFPIQTHNCTALILLTQTHIRFYIVGFSIGIDCFYICTKSNPHTNLFSSEEVHNTNLNTVECVFRSNQIFLILLAKRSKNIYDLTIKYITMLLISCNLTLLQCGSFIKQHMNFMNWYVLKV